MCQASVADRPFGGFSVSASWGEDDMWDVSARYAGEFNGFKLAAAAAYTDVSSKGCNLGAGGITAAGVTSGCVASGPGGYNNLGALDADYFQAGLYIEHVPTGVFGMANYGKFENRAVVSTAIVSDSQDTWYFGPRSALTNPISNPILTPALPRDFTNEENRPLAGAVSNFLYLGQALRS